MTTKQVTLQNGLRIMTVDIPDARSLTVNIVVGTGSRYEDYSVNGGVSHFLEHLLFKGSKKYPTAATIAEAVDAVGGYNNAYTSEDITSFYIKVPAAHAGLAIDILVDMMQNPLLDPSEVDRERGVIVEEMNVYRDDPARFVGTLIPSLIFPDSPLGCDIIGSEEIIKSISADDISAYQKLHYQPKNMVIVAAGKVDHDSIVEQVTALLDEIPSHEPEHFSPVGSGLSSDIAVTQEKPTAQAHFIIAARAYPYLHQSDAAAKVMSAILGRGMSSRLFTNVREQQGLAYTIYSEINNYIDTGIFQVYAGVNIDKIDDAVESVMHELKRITIEDVSVPELNKAKQQLSAGLVMSLESNTSIADRLGSQLSLLGNVKTIDETIEQINAVTIEAVRSAAQELLEKSNLRFAIIAPSPDNAAEHFKNLVNSKE